ncbi:MAG TPA: response regulator transcription factor [Candidatus Scatomorpha gallistercoris]|nr:response regulator transcription factor [Candidatus Scatomorpha gallistercoris]
MAWKVDICDDEVQECSILSSYLDKMHDDTGEQFSVRIFHSAEALLQNTGGEPDLVLLDIRMNGMSGMDAARELRARGSRVSLVFITTMAQYAIEGYEVHAFGFLRKPLKYAVFKRLMEDLLAHLRREIGYTWEIRNGADSLVVHTKYILYLEVYGHSVFANLLDGTSLPCQITLSKAEEQLTRIGFFRCHKSYIINLRHVERIDSDIVTLSGGKAVPLSRHRRKTFLSAFARFREGMV